MTREVHVDALTVVVGDDTHEMAESAARDARAAIVAAIAARGEANVMLATGNSQLAFLDAFIRNADVAWERVRAFHMDEYVGISADHSASFRRYMRERVATRVPLKEFHYIEGDAADAEAEARRYEALLREFPLDVCCCGIGENGHLAFNDPPVAKFDDPRDVKIVALEPQSRRQQVGEGHFPSIDEVPMHAITVTVPALLRAARVLAIVPEARKVPAVRATLHDPITPACPATVLRRQPHATLYLDHESARGISEHA
ncbi:MAG TPA: 6-phosphogluconolactonase [Acidimicrobiia bacterium]|nr:6-phosphogluconolactonase [Acidimicrobiia bacterium]